MILKFLIGKSPVPARAVVNHVQEETARVRRILAALESEGFIRKSRDGYRLAE